MQTRSKFIVPKFEKKLDKWRLPNKLLFLRLIQTMPSKFHCLITLKKLGVKVGEHYLKKISTIGIDPVLIGGKHFEPGCLPPVESTHLLCCFVFKISYYTQKSLPQSVGLQSNLDYYREGWDNTLRSLFGMRGRPRRIMFARSLCAILP